MIGMSGSYSIIATQFLRVPDSCKIIMVAVCDIGALGLASGQICEIDIQLQLLLSFKKTRN